MRRVWGSVLVAALMLTGLGVPSASAASAPTDAEQERTTVELTEVPLETKTTKEAERAERLKAHADRLKQPGVLAAELECDDLREIDWPANGLVYDHFTFCHERQLLATWRACPPRWPGDRRCPPVAWALFTVRTEGEGIVGSREVRFDVLLTGFRPGGLWPGRRLNVNIECTPEPRTNATCVPGVGVGRNDTLQGWMRNPLARTDFSSPEAGSTGRDKLAWYDFGTRVTIPPNGRDPGDTVKMFTNGFRCDSADYVAGKRGCVFDQVEEIWGAPLNTSDPNRNQALQHIYDAQTAPETTYPVWDDDSKTIPGAPQSLQPLSRNYYDKRMRVANRRAAVAVCRDVWGANYAQPRPEEPPAQTYDCDEYPFCSTFQGAASGDRRFSARRIRTQDNEAAGRMLATFYSRQRVLHDDPYYVFIITGAGLAPPPIEPGIPSAHCTGEIGDGETTHLTTATTGGGLFHAVRNTGDGSWTRFEDVEASANGALAPVDTAAAVAGGRRHLVVPAEDGELWHSIRSDTGVWTPFGDVEDFAGEVGSVRRVAAAGIGGDLHVVAVTVLGDVLHTIRRPNGTWTPLHSVEDFAGAVSGVEDVAAAAMPDGTLQVVLSLGDGRLLHSLRAPSGSWTAWGDVEAFAGDPGTPETIAAVESGEVLHLVADYGSAGVRHAVRRADGNWSPLAVVDAGDPGPVADVAVASVGNNVELVVADTNGPLWHAVLSNGAWGRYTDARPFTGDPGTPSRVTLTGP